MAARLLAARVHAEVLERFAAWEREVRKFWTLQYHFSTIDQAQDQSSLMTTTQSELFRMVMSAYLPG